ncbi:hypothetical protein B4082_1405 [Bacillus cereus]|uniref:Uncharacterized protein n=1 Tax=Bacillus cereus TaxID=1396 RepID=A0A161TCP1_BACCE|nr:hypothetical protein B4082_1405 [Bacillus cereus]
MILNVIEKRSICDEGRLSMDIVDLRSFWNIKEMEKIISPSLSFNYI